MTTTSHTPEEFARAYYAWHVGAPEEDFWAVQTVIDLSMHERWDELWATILVLCTNAAGADRVRELGLVGAGPLEDLLDGAGAAYIDRIESEAGLNHDFAVALTGVWPSQIDMKVWVRVVEVCRTVPDPIDGTYRY